MLSSINNSEFFFKKNNNKKKNFLYRILLFINIVPYGIVFLFLSPSYAQSPPDGTLGWCGYKDNACSYVSSAESACAITKATFNPDAVLRGINYSSGGLFAVCDWCYYHNDGVGCFGVGPTPTFFECQSGYYAVAGGRCIKNNDPYYESSSCRESGGQTTPKTDHPVSVLTGTKSFTYTDFQSSRPDLRLQRTFVNHRSFTRAFHDFVGLGKEWAYDFQYELTVNSQSVGDNLYSLLTPEGVSIDFARRPDGTFVPSYSGLNISVVPSKANYVLKFVGTWPQDTSTLYTNKARWQLYLPNGEIYLFEGVNTNYPTPSTPDYSIARPILRTDTSGRKTSFAYGSIGELTSLSDDFGGVLSFVWSYKFLSGDIQSDSYKIPINIMSAALPDGTNISYYYDSSLSSTPSLTDRLLKFERKNSTGKIIDAQTYSFDNSMFPRYITKIQSFDGVIINNVTYDTRGRATHSGIAGDMDASDITYDEAQMDSYGIFSSLTRTVTNSLGKKTTYNFKSTGYPGEYLLQNVNGVASTNCVASNSSLTYDRSQFVASETDEESRKTTYSRDSRGRPTTITRGAP